MFDIAILGLGPGGSTLARLLDPTLRVIVLDQKNLTGGEGFQKPCGGLLAPDAQEYMARLGLGMPLEILADPQIFTVRTMDLQAGLERYYQRCYLNFNRHKFDLWLASLIPKQVEVIDRAVCLSIQKEQDHYQLNYHRLGEYFQISARTVVGADGANSLVRRTFCSTPIRQYVCIQQLFHMEQFMAPYFTCFFDPAVTDSYGWINLKDRQVEFGVALPKKYCRNQFENLKNRFIEQGFPLRNGGDVQACLVNRPRSVRELEFGRDNVFLIGEAAGLVSPSSLEGISYALESAHILSTVLNHSIKDANTPYFRASAKLRRKILIKLLKCPFLYHPLLRRWVMKSGVTSMRVSDPR